MNRYGEIVVEFPLDLLALQVAHVQDFLLGRAPSLRDRPAQALRARSEGNFFGSHNWRHLALHHIERADFAGALALYDQRIRTPGTQVAMELVDATALLWRLHLRGADTGARWTKVADSWQRLNESGYYAFNDVHALIALVGAARAA